MKTESEKHLDIILKKKPNHRTRPEKDFVILMRNKMPDVQETRQRMARAHPNMTFRISP